MITWLETGQSNIFYWIFVVGVVRR